MCMIKNIMQRGAAVAAILIASVSLLAACSSQTPARAVEGEQATEEDWKAYYLSEENIEIVGEKIASPKETLSVNDLVEALKKKPKAPELTTTMGVRTNLLGCKHETGQLTLNFDSDYRQLTASEEVLFRQALVYTFTQIEGIKYVIVTIEGEPLVLADGREVGAMSPRAFIENAGKEINSYAKTTLHLYFADSSGTSLVRYDESVVYSSNIPMERLVVDNLIEGPDTKVCFPTVSTEAKVNNVIVRDGICYCDLDSKIVDQAYNVSEETVFYSIVNSLCEVRGISKVQISIDGETDRVFRNEIRLDKAYEKNLDIIK